MFNRRQVMAGAIVASAALSAPASACRAPGRKDRDGYTRVTDQFLTAWWARDLKRFGSFFGSAERAGPSTARALFDRYYTKPTQRFRAPLLFNGAAAVVQVITPQPHNRVQGICGGYAGAEMFLVKFDPDGRIESVALIDDGVLAEGEWEDIPGAPKIDFGPYWRR